MKYLFFILFISLLSVYSDQGCNTPLECYEQAIQILKDQTEKFQTTAQNLQNTINDLNNQISDLKTQITSQNQVIETYKSQQNQQISSVENQIASQNQVIETYKSQQNQVIETYKSQLNQGISSVQNGVNSINSLISGRGLDKFKVNVGGEVDLFFDGFPNYFFIRKDRGFGDCEMSGHSCKIL